MKNKCARTTIAINPNLFRAAKARAEAMGYRAFSQYISYLVDKDVRERPDHVTIREEPPGYGKSVIHVPKKPLPPTGKPPRHRCAAHRRDPQKPGINIPGA